MVIEYLPGIYQFGSSIHLTFSLQLSIQSYKGFHGFLDKVYEFIRYLVHFEDVYYPALWDHILRIFVAHPGHK